MLHIISPHIDDAVLSLGGTISNFSVLQKEIMVHYVFSISDWVNDEILNNFTGDVMAISALRKKEEENVARQLGYQYQMMEFLDSPLRNGSEAEAIDMISSRIYERIANAASTNDTIFFPLGINHLDHVLVRNVGIEMLKDGFSVLFYEDLPYSAAAQFDYQERYNTICHFGLTPLFQEIDIESKLNNLKLYASQVSPGWLRDIKNYAYSVKDNKYYERYWQPLSVEKILTFRDR
jgi:LmbE family N-acetylglucosaminyl deacetylase